MPRFQVDDVVRLKSTGNLYKILETPDTFSYKVEGKWTVSYQYTDVVPKETTSINKYGRSEADFNQSFELVSRI